MADIFVSYAAEDRARIEPLIEALKSEGWSIWWDRELLAGPRFAETIEHELEAARCVVVVWSERAVTSGWCLDEAGEGLERRRLVPVRIDDVRLPLGFRSLQTASLVGWPETRGDIETFLASVRAVLSDAPTSGPRSTEDGLAILPFVNLSSDPEQDFFCDGLSEDLIDLLVRNSDLRVIARTSSFQFKGTTRDVREIGALLGVRHVVEGSVRRAGNRVRVVAQLVRASDGGHEWSDRYDRDLDDIFALQDEITGKIAEALNAALRKGEPRSERNPRAHLLLLEAKQLLDMSGGGSAVSLRAKDLLQKAVRLDPDYAMAWALLARAYGQVVILLTRHDSESSEVDFQGLTIEECTRLRREAAERGLAIDPGNSRIGMERAWMRFFAGRKADAARMLQVLIERTPDDPDLLAGLVRPLTWAKRPAEAVAVARKVDSRDPLNVGNISNMAYGLFSGGHVEEARAQAERALSINPAEGFTLWLAGLIPLLEGDATRALAVTERMPSNSSDRYAMRAMALHRLERAQDAQDAFETLKRRWPGKTYEIAAVHAWMGEPDQAFSHLHKASTQPTPEDAFGAVNTLIDPRWRPYHGDPRWQAFLEATHQTEHDLAQFELDLTPLKLED
jgi:adenylate cyclase